MIEAIAAMADAAGPGLDAAELLHGVVTECVSLLDVDTAVVQMAREDGNLETAAGCGDDVGAVEALSARLDGPGAECLRRGVVISSADLGAARWDAFTTRARALGFRSVEAVPMRARGEVVGSLILARRSPGRLAAAELDVARALATVASLTFLNLRDTRSHARLRDQLQQALDSRVIIEQAKGYLARSHDESPSEAFARLRNHARETRTRIAEVAAEVVAHRLVVV